MSAASLPPTPSPNEHSTTRERVLAIAGWLVEGKLRPECVDTAMQDWQVSRRTAQVYVARAAARIVRATTFEDPLFAMKLSQVQRDRLHQELQELLRSGEHLPLPHWKMKIQTIQATLKLLDSRDRTAAKIAQLEQGQARRTPPAPSCKRSEKNTGEAGAKARIPGETKLDEGDTKDKIAAKASPEAHRSGSQPSPQPSRTQSWLPPRPVSMKEFVEQVQAAILPENPLLPTAHIPVVARQQKSKSGKETRPAQHPRSTTAPKANSCALETARVADATSVQGAGAAGISTAPAAGP